MASSLTGAQRQELKDAFDVFDAGRFAFQWKIIFVNSIDGSGKISQKELGSIFQALNVKVSDSDLKKLVTEMDTDRSGMCR